MGYTIRNDVKKIRFSLSMVTKWLSCILFTLLPIFTSGNTSKSFYSKNDPILDSFVIKLNTIIRTSDSLDAGARYLSETEMSSNQQCLLWCWDNRNCTLAVYEEKSKGSCYLFDCGPPEQMKCKFTGHDHYTSSLIKFNRNSIDGNTIDQRNQAKHENDLVNLRISATSVKPISVFNNNNSKGVDITSTTSGSLSPPPSSGPTYTSTSASVKACKRHQFQCRNTSDCIAIYNVCDGIVQCSDGSDEAVDLHCPTEPVYPSVESQVAIPPSNKGPNHQRSSPPTSSSSITIPTSTINFANSMDKNVAGRIDVKENEPINLIGVEGSNGGGQFVPKKSVNAQAFNYPKTPDIANDLKENGKMSMGSHKYDDYNPIRDKFETKPYYPSYGSQYYQPPPPPPSHSDFYSGPRSRGFSSDNDYPNTFSRDYWQPENGLIASGANVQRSNNMDRNLINPIYHQYRPANDIGSINVNNNGNGVIGPQAQSVSTLTRSIPWPKNSYVNSYQRKSNEFSNMESASRMDLIDTQGSGSGGVNSEMGVNIRQNNAVRPPQEHQTPQIKVKNSQSLADDLKDHTNKLESSTRPSTIEPTTSTSMSSTQLTQTIQMVPIKGVSHLNSDKMTNDWALPVAVTHLSSSESGRDTNSAVIALVLGVGITAMLVTLVGCRMKYIKRRIARRGRNLAHDADYLVNGMYL